MVEQLDISYVIVPEETQVCYAFDETCTIPQEKTQPQKAEALYEFINSITPTHYTTTARPLSPRREKEYSGEVTLHPDQLMFASFEDYRAYYKAWVMKSLMAPPHLEESSDEDVHRTPEGERKKIH
ncbi:unnamed protein product [Phytophthora lilii]|uniref:Unnamed protein product n=1 Tax=Phytophthora lilii TaxID=2077276 RepID=A0A9W6YF21_9STRA|nr:unnamed protein product [Phytophthora lilii]